MINIDLTKEIDILKSNMPDGSIFQAKNSKTTNLYKLIKTLSILYNEVRTDSNKKTKELNIYNANEYISLWESYVGIPDENFNLSSNLEDRIKTVILKLIGTTAYTIKELKAIIQNVFPEAGEVLIENGSGRIGFPLTFPITFLPKSLASKTIYITFSKEKSKPFFPITFPITFSDGNFSAIESFIKLISPYQYNLIFQYN